TGTPSSCAIATAIPPFAEPSSFVSTTPVTSTAWPKSRACWRPFWPVVASITSSVSCGAPSSRWPITRRTLESSSIRFACVCSRPAVSTTTTLRPRDSAAPIASYATAAGSPPRSEPTKSAPARWAQISSCSSAAARNVSAAATTTECPCCASLAASLPIVVVLPVPLTPTTRTTLGAPPTFSVPESPKSAATSSARASPRSPSSPRASSRWTSSAVARTPTSAWISASSSRSQARSSPGSNAAAWICSVRARRDFESESRWREEKGEEERDRAERLLAARQERQPLHLLAGGPQLDLDAGLALLVLRVGQAQAPFATREERRGDVCEIPLHGVERLGEASFNRLRQLRAQLLELGEALLEILALNRELLEARLLRVVLLLRERIHLAERLAAALEPL